MNEAQGHLRSCLASNGEKMFKFGMSAKTFAAAAFITALGAVALSGCSSSKVEVSSNPASSTPSATTNTESTIDRCSDFIVNSALAAGKSADPEDTYNDLVTDTNPNWAPCSSAFADDSQSFPANPDQLAAVSKAYQSRVPSDLRLKIGDGEDKLYYRAGHESYANTPQTGTPANN